MAILLTNFAPFFPLLHLIFSVQSPAAAISTASIVNNNNQSIQHQAHLQQTTTGNTQQSIRKLE
jgi:hypothetical protein